MSEGLQHNYLPKVLAMYERGEIASVGLHEVRVYHDDWCEIYQGTWCNCDPDVVLKKHAEN